MTALFHAWPYAALATILFDWITPQILFYIIFPHPMDQTIKPDHNKWTVWVDGAIKNVVWSSWNDAYTLRFSAAGIVAPPDRVLVKYTGIGEKLKTTWGKDWEPWGYITGTDIDYGWENILDVDIANTRVKVNGQFLLSTLTVTAGLNQVIDVAGVNVIYFDCSAGAISISGFLNGEDGQVLYLARLCVTANNVILNHQRANAFQSINLHAGADETLRAEYGGWTLVCKKPEWFDLSHAKHV